MTPARHARTAAGFTLVELLISMVVIGIAVTVLVVLLSTIYNTGTQTVAAGTLQDQARTAVDGLVADLRQAYTGDPATPPVAGFTPTSITFYSPDRQQPFHLRKLGYQLSGGNFQRALVLSTNTDGPPWSGLTTLGPWADVAPSIVANPGGTPVFSYQKADGTPATAAKDIDKVVVTLTTSLPGSRGSASTYTSSAELRTVGS